MFKNRLIKTFFILGLLGVLFPTKQVLAVETDTFEQDGSYHVVNFTTGEDYERYQAFTDALRYYTRMLNDDERVEGNLGIIMDGVVRQAEKAIVAFHTNEGCDAIVTFVDDVDELENTTNGCNGIDAAYLTTDSSGTKVKFMLSSVVGWADIEDVDIIPLDNITTRLTAYNVIDDTLYHEIKTTLTDDNYASIISNGKAPSYLTSDETYYSYDGHYFYTSLETMLMDYQNNTRENSENPEDPFYNYFQFVSHRTVTNATYEEVESYFNETMGLKGPIDSYRDDDKDSEDDTLSRSQFYESLPAFYQYQYEYGANALMMMAVSANESGFGRSSLSFTRNNLFGHAAYDSDIEANTSRYLNISNSVYAHAKYYISGSYCSPLKAQYHGGFFGNKSAGMNVNYSSDPYWGEKAASYYHSLDEALGSKDENAYTLGIKTSASTIFVYQSPENNAKVFYDSGENPDASFVILDAFSNDAGDWYQVQADTTLNDESLVDLSYNYDYRDDIGYIKQSDIQIVLESQKPFQTDFVPVTFEGNGGLFPGEEEVVTYFIPTGNTAIAVAPQKANSLFTGWDIDTRNVGGEEVYTSTYKDVSAISMKQLPLTNYEVNDRIDLKNGIVEVQFSDGTSQDFPLTSSMVSAVDFEKEGKQEVNVHFAGCDTSYEIEVSKEADQTRTGVKNRIVNIIDEFRDKETLEEGDVERLLALKQDIDATVVPYLTQSQLRTFDTLLRVAIDDRINYIVEDNDYNLGVSGLSISVPLDDSLEKSAVNRDTYRVKINQGINEEANTVLSQYASVSDNDVFDAFTITMQKNFDVFHLRGPVLFSIGKPIDDQTGEVYTVYYYDEEDGDVEKCYTRQSDNAITFLGNQDGQYMLVGRRTSNIYASEDPVESVTNETRSFDFEYAIANATIGFAALVVLWLLLRGLRKKHKKVKVAKQRIEKNEQKKNEPLPPVDVTQAMERFDTEVLSRKDIILAEQEANQKAYEEARARAKEKFVKRKYEQTYVENSNEKDEALKLLKQLHKNDGENRD